MAPITSTLVPTAGASLIAFFFQPDNSNAGDIYTMRADGGQLVNVTNNPEPGYVPAWAPDGQQLAFISDRTGHPEIYLVRPDGSELHQFTHTPVDSPGVSGFAWSPDGQRLAVTHALPPNAIYPFGYVDVVRVDGSYSTTVPYPGDQPKWSPDGRWLTFDGLDPQGYLGVFIARGDGTGSRIVVSTQDKLTGTSESLTGFAWAPDSAHLAYLTQGPLTGTYPHRQWAQGTLHARLYMIQPDGNHGQLLLNLDYLPDGLIGPEWSPDGRYLLYLIGHSQGGCFTVHLFAVATRTDTALQGVCYEPRTTMPDWSPDGRYLALSAQPSSIMLLDVADALQHPQNVVGTRLTLGPDYTSDPVWQPIGR